MRLSTSLIYSSSISSYQKGYANIVKRSSKSRVASVSRHRQTTRSVRRVCCSSSSNRHC